MKIRSLTGLFWSLLMVVLAGCGGGGGGGGSVAGGTPLSGTASKGPIAGGTVKVFQIISSATTNPRAGIPRIGSSVLAQGTTAADGSYSLTLPAGSGNGGLMVQITGGTYTDESSGLSKSLDAQYGASGMRAIFGNISGAVRRGEAVSVSVTPYTEMAVVDAGSNLTDGQIEAANGKIAAAFGLPDIVRTRPLDPNQPFSASGSADAKKYALALATVSQYQKDFGAGGTMAQISAALLGQLTSGVLSAEIQTRLGAASNNYAGGSRNPNPELKTPDANTVAPKDMHTSPSAPLSASIGTSVAVSAHVVKSDGTPVPDGTLVNFASSSGTLSAASAATTNGTASVTLTSATPGSAQVTASSGTVSRSVAVISFVDVNAPVSMTLSSSPNPGVTVGPPVLISASVLRGGGGAVQDGTVVSFAIASGSGTLSAANPTSGGVANVNLTSSAAGASVTVIATAGTVSQTITVPFVGQPTKAIVKLRTTGTLASGTRIGGVKATLNYATGKGLSIANANIAASGAAAAPGSNSSLIPNSTTAGQVILGLLNTDGIAVGEFVTLSFDIAAGKFPTEADFSVGSGIEVIDAATHVLSNIGVGIASVTIQ